VGEGNGLIDHLVYATPSLDVVDQLGIPVSPGGQHVGLGTRNFLADLGGGAYLEVVGPDPDQPEPSQPRPFDLDSLAEPRLVTWAIRVTDINRAVAEAEDRGYDPGPIHPMSRERPDGVLLSWRLTIQDDDSVLPFLIDWGATPHPSRDAVHGSELLSFHIVHPDPAEVRKGLSALGADVPVVPGEPGLVARIRTPQGEVTLQ
jgi:hypothetical protein